MTPKPVTTRLPEDVVGNIEAVAKNPATQIDSKSAVIREIVTQSFD
jgi:hypothetical protein